VLEAESIEVNRAPCWADQRFVGRSSPAELPTRKPTEGTKGRPSSCTPLLEPRGHPGRAGLRCRRNGPCCHPRKRGPMNVLHSLTGESGDLPIGRSVLSYTRKAV
jgi:hypothetical protein